MSILSVDRKNGITIRQNDKGLFVETSDIMVLGTDYHTARNVMRACRPAAFIAHGGDGSEGYEFRDNRSADELREDILVAFESFKPFVDESDVEWPNKYTHTLVDELLDDYAAADEIRESGIMSAPEFKRLAMRRYAGYDPFVRYDWQFAADAAAAHFLYS